jgi:hypothetical protein
MLTLSVDYATARCTDSKDQLYRPCTTSTVYDYVEQLRLKKGALDSELQNLKEEQARSKCGIKIQ